MHPCAEACVPPHVRFTLSEGPGQPAVSAAQIDDHGAGLVHRKQLVLGDLWARQELQVCGRFTPRGGSCSATDACL